MTKRPYPLSGSTPRHDVLHEGIPIWLRESIRAWLERTTEGIARGDRAYLRDLASTFDARSRLLKPLAPQLNNVYLWSVVINQTEEVILDFVDFLLPGVADTMSYEVQSLDLALEEGGSIWRVAQRDGRYGLERRVDETAIAAADKVMAESGHAGTMLEQAWQKVYGRNPDPKGAYAKAVLAVEEVACPKVIPDDPKPTLGKVASAMENQRNWRYVLHEGGKESAQDAPLHQVQELWHRDPRHADGKSTYRDPSQQEAETAVFLAVGLVHMFHNGLIARR